MRSKGGSAGFTLVELMVVIAIIVILVALAIPLYSRHREKATVTSYVLPVARNCSLSVASRCIVEGDFSATDPVNNSDFSECTSPVSTSMGDVTLMTVNDFSCSNGKLTAGKLEAQFGTSYEVDCEVVSGEVECTIVGYTASAD